MKLKKVSHIRSKETRIYKLRKTKFSKSYLNKYRHNKPSEDKRVYKWKGFMIFILGQITRNKILSQVPNKIMIIMRTRKQIFWWLKIVMVMWMRAPQKWRCSLSRIKYIQLISKTLKNWMKNTTLRRITKSRSN